MKRYKIRWRNTGENVYRWDNVRRTLQDATKMARIYLGCFDGMRSISICDADNGEIRRSLRNDGENIYVVL